jgi:hypothetical protein
MKMLNLIIHDCLDCPYKCIGDKRYYYCGHIDSPIDHVIIHSTNPEDLEGVLPKWCPLDDFHEWYAPAGTKRGKIGGKPITPRPPPPQDAVGGCNHDFYEVFPSMGDPSNPSGKRCKKCGKQVWY